MHLLFFAHKAEAQAFISKGAIKLVKQNGFKFYVTESFILFITGTPPQLPELVNFSSYTINKVINLGTAARVNTNLKINEIYPANLILNADKEILPEGTLLSLSLPYQSKMNLHCDFVDQEAYYLKQWSERHNLEFKSFKILSDSGENDLKFVLQNAAFYSQKLYDYYQKIKML